MDKVDAILAGDEPIVPSSGFATAVMQRVLEEAATPPPIPFPWRRGVPGFVLAAVVLSGAALQFIRAFRSSAFTLSWAQLGIDSSQNAQIAIWLVAALGVAASCWLLVRRLASSSGLL